MLNPVLDTLFGSKTASSVLLFVEAYSEGHANRIATTYDMGVSVVQDQLRKFETNGLLVSRLVGRTRVYTWNERNPTVRNLRTLLRAELDALPVNVTKKYFRQRQRPRRPGKRLV